MASSFFSLLAHASKTYFGRLYRLRFWPRYSLSQNAAQDVLTGTEGGFQALHAAYSFAAAIQEVQTRRIDLFGDLFMLLALVTSPVSLFITVINVANGVTPLLFFLPFTCFFLLTSIGLSLWFTAGMPDDIEGALRRALPIFGGLQQFPASIWATENAQLLRTFPVFQTFFLEFLLQSSFSPKESEVFHQLLADGYEGTLGNLIATSHSLAS